MVDKQYNENPEELFREHLGDNAEQSLDDLRWAEQFFAEQQPEFDEKKQAALKSRVNAELKKRKPKSIRFAFYRSLAAAAIFVVFMGLFVYMNQPQPIPGPAELLTAEEIFTGAMNEIESISDDEIELAELAAEIQTIENQLLAVEIGDYDYESDSIIDTLEEEISEMENDFWKG